MFPSPLSLVFGSNARVFRRTWLALFTLAIFLGGTSIGRPARAGDRFITLASTTSTENSGLLGDILPRFTEETGIDVRVVAVGTGAALRIARSGDADVLLVHHRPSEDVFVADGYGVARHDVMYNDFIVVGPHADPAGIEKGADGSVSRALQLIAATKAPFVSRGDDSGTHKAERGLWKRADLDPQAESGGWYRETGSGMGATLNTANAMGAYTLTDRGTWIAFRNKGELSVMLEGDPPLFNPYGVILVSPTKHPHVKAEDGQALIDWLLSAEGQQAIADFRVDGEVLFKPNTKLPAQSQIEPQT